MYAIEYTTGTGARATDYADTLEAAEAARAGIIAMYASIPGMSAHADGVTVTKAPTPIDRALARAERIAPLPPRSYRVERNGHPTAVGVTYTHALNLVHGYGTGTFRIIDSRGIGETFIVNGG